MTTDDFQFCSQDQFGKVYHDGDYMLFQSNALRPETIAYMVDFYVDEPNPPSGHIPVHIGSSYILPGNLKTSNGFLTTPITGRKRRPIGQLTIEYLVVHPIKDYSCDLSTSYSKYWKTSWRGLDIGHRGSGSSHGTNPTSCSNVRENTIGSLRHAGEHGADFVEFDVQLSKDFIPVLFHDFHVGIVTERKGEGSDVLTIPVKELTLEQLHKLKLVHKEEKDPSNGGEDGNEEFQLFPTLEKALQVLKPSIGFNIEIKWTMQLKDTTYELQHPHDLNFFLDTVLRVVLEHGCLRKIVFSCFHPDVCTMLRLKQNRYPVLFLTQGETERWPQYLDPRTHSVPHAIRFAKATELLGVNAHSEDLIRNPSLIQLVKDSGLVLFCWGEENNDPKIIRQLKAWGVDGVIYDKIDTYNEKVLKVSIFSLEEKLEVDMYL